MINVSVIFKILEILVRAVNQGLLDFNQKPGMIVILVCDRLDYTLVELRMNTIE